MTVIEEAEPIARAPLRVVERLTALMHRRATWVLIDQAVVSAGNFLTTRILVQHLSLAEFGMSNVLMETMNFLNGLQTALVIYPLTIKSATGSDLELGRLTTGAARLTYGLLPFLGGATLAAVGMLHGGAFAISAVIALLAWQLQETMRRALMSDLRFADAVWGDALRYLGQTVVLFLLSRWRPVDLNVAFIIMALCATAATLLQATQVKLKPILPWQLKIMARDFWHLGRWMLLNNASGIITALGYWWVLNWAHAKEVVAIFGAIILPFKLANPIMTSMGALIMPAVARADATEGVRAAARVALRYTLFGATLLTPYFLFLLIFPQFALRKFTGSNPEYVKHTTELQMFVMNYTIVFLSAMISAWLGGLGRARWSFYAQVLNIAVTLSIGLPFTWAWGVKGLIVGGMISAGAGAAMSMYFIGVASRSKHPPADGTTSQTAPAPQPD